jgi:hypothetical protein
VSVLSTRSHTVRDAIALYTDFLTEIYFLLSQSHRKTFEHQQLHVTSCAGNHKTLSAEKRWKARLCHRCDTWFDQLTDLREHYRHHFEELDLYCGILRLRNIVVSAGRCPFCLGNSTWARWGEYEKVVTAFTTSDDFTNHLRSHFAELCQQHNLVQCPHPRCVDGVAYSWQDLVHHFYDIHAIIEDIFGTESFPTVRPATVDKSLFVSSDTEESEDEAWMRLQVMSAKKGQKRTKSPYEKLVKDLRG